MKHILLSLIAFFASLNVCAYDFKNGDLYYNILGNSPEVEVTYDVDENASYRGVIHIPSTVVNGATTYSVVAIGDKAFYKSKITDIHIPNNIKRIGKQAFRNAEQLSNVTLPMGITSLPEYIFEGTSIAAIAIPSDVTLIGLGAFQSCQNLTTLFIPAKLKTILAYGLYACHSLTEVYTLAVTPPDATAFAVFQGLDAIDIIVPSSSVEVYSKTSPWNQFSIYEQESFSMSMTVQGVRDGGYDIVSLGDSKAYKIYDDDKLIAVTASDRYYIPNDGTAKTYKIVPTNYFFDDAPHYYTTIVGGSVGDIVQDDIIIHASSGNIYIDGDVSDKNVAVYDVYGNLRYSGVATPVITLEVNTPAIYIVKCGTKVAKVIL